jgi:type IV pilus assembly protein PilN
MPSINLLPWREELRQRRRTQFYAAIGVAFAGALLVVLISNTVFSAIIGNQKERNDFLGDEITALDRRIEEILGLEDEKERLLARMEIIEQLQRSRPEIVHVFDEMAMALPEGVYLTSVKQSGRRLEVRGAAESNTRVSAFMRRIEESDWLTNPDLEVVEVKRGRNAEGSRASEFTVFARQESPLDGKDDEDSR